MQCVPLGADSPVLVSSAEMLSYWPQSLEGSALENSTLEARTLEGCGDLEVAIWKSWTLKDSTLTTWHTLETWEVARWMAEGMNRFGYIRAIIRRYGGKTEKLWLHSPVWGVAEYITKWQ